MENDLTMQSDLTLRLYDRVPEAWVKLPALAERLGVKPLEGSGKFVEIAIQLNDGRRYDVIDLINAVLDRLDK